jgi:catalase
MSETLGPATTPERPRLGAARALGRFVLIVAILAATAGLFAYLGGWLTPWVLTPTKFVDTFEAVDGHHPGYRRNHARGLGVTGFFEANGKGVRLSKANVFKEGRVPVIGRFSFGGGNIEGGEGPGVVRGLALEFSLPDGEQWRTAMIYLPVFPFNTPEAFHENLLASKPDPQTGKPDPEKKKAFLERHPETAKALEHITKNLKVSSGFDNTTFHALHVFRFIDAAGTITPVRWLVTPEQAFEPANDKGDLFKALAARIQEKEKPLRWHLIAVVGKPDDPIDPTLPWPADREKVDLGTITLDRVDDDAARDINFDPLVLPVGIEPSSDPLLSARSAIYSNSFTRRAGEGHQPRKGD